jgi:hypothetical protein
MMTVYFDKAQLVDLLRRTKREQNISGKSQSQVMACVLDCNDGIATTTSLVRDGKTSLSQFRCPAENNEQHQLFNVPDIDAVLGILSFHSQNVRIGASDSTLSISSGKKRTTVKTSGSAMAFPHSTETIDAWNLKSADLASKFSFDDDGLFLGYSMANGTTRTPILNWTVDAIDLFEALRSDNINGQRFNRYHVDFDMTGSTNSEPELVIAVGDELKGLTTYRFEDSFTLPDGEQSFDWTFNGGLENVLKGLGGKAIVSFLDFRQEKQGIRIVINLGNGGWVYQAGVLG